METAEDEIQAIWQSYKANSTDDLRNRLIGYYLPIVRDIARKIHNKLTKNNDIDDLISEGVFGLMSVVESFDLARGTKFEIFCKKRIEGSILDFLRRTDHLSRFFRLKANKTEDEKEKFYFKHGRYPRPSDLEDDFFEPIEIGSLDRELYANSSNRHVEKKDLIVDIKFENPFANIEKNDLCKFLKSKLTTRERTIINLYYWEHLTLEEIGNRINLSESSISLIHSRAIDRITNFLKEKGLSRSDIL